jgi:hypothetical protein
VIVEPPKEIKEQTMTLNDLATNFIYQSDGKIDSWRILDASNLRGDCDDYACTALYIITGSLLSFWTALVFGSAKMCFVNTKTGGGHLVLHHKGLYIDNWSRKLVTKQHMESLGHKFQGWKFPFWITAIKMMYGKLWGAKG